jgi:hypothetical protein
MAASSWTHEYATRWHDAWEIVGAFATFAAVVFSLVSAGRSAAARRTAEEQRDAAMQRQQSLEDEARRDRLEAQARGVAVWHQKGGQDPLTGATDPDLLTVYVKNYTQMPIFDAKGAVNVGGVLTLTDPRTMVFPTGTAEFYIRSGDFVGPWESVQPCVKFRDTAGVQWCRYSTGQLVEVP